MKKYLVICGIVCMLLLLSFSDCQGKNRGIGDKYSGGNYKVFFEYDKITLNSHFGFIHPRYLGELPNLGVF